MQKRRAPYVDTPNAQRPPFVLKGDNLAAMTYWHGRLLNQWANKWVSYHTNGAGNYVTTAMEDTGTAQALTWLARAGRVDRLGQTRRVVVEHQALDAALELRLEEACRTHRADGPAHGGADPMRLLDAGLIEQVRRQAGVELQLVLVERVGAPLAQAPADGVRADHAEAVRQMLRELVHVAARSRQAVPGDDGAAVVRAPLGVVDLPSCASDIPGFESHHDSSLGLFFGAGRRDAGWPPCPRSRPTMPVGK